MPKVSVILPAYNVEKFIAKSIDSILSQTFTDFELLVVIDGSPDNSKAIAESFADPRIIIFEKENGGLSDARNYGLERAKGDYVYFMDSDDWIEPELLEQTVAVLEKEKRDFVVFGYIQDNEDLQGNVFSQQQKLPNKELLSKGVDYGLTTDLLGILGYAWNKVYKKAFLVDNNFHFEKGISLVEDILFNSLVYKQSDEIRIINKTFYHYINRQVPTLIKKFHQNSFDLNLWKLERLSDFFESWDFKNRKELLGYALVQGIRYCVHNLFSFQNSLTFTEKRMYVKKMLYHPKTKEYINSYIPNGKVSVFYKSLIKHKNYNLISIFAIATK
ncbi:MAG: glycosyltransferase [Chryseobacterium sp.]|nr:glycosyltransferase [Chryseobacterium sp.]